MAHITLSLMVAGRTDRNFKKRQRRLRPVRPSRKNELWYKSELLRIVRVLSTETEKELLPFVRQTLNAVGDSTVTDADKLGAIRAELARIATRFGGIVGIANRLSALAAERNLKAVDTGLIASIRAAIGVNVAGALGSNAALARAVRTATQANIELITSIPVQYFEKLEKAISKNFTAGVRFETLAEKIQEVGDVTESRAKLIARDQTSKMASSFNQVRQTSLGIEKYIWQTAGDERVRETHAENDGKTFRWDNPPEETGNPGEDIQCRCVAIPVFDLDAMEQELES